MTRPEVASSPWRIVLSLVLLLYLVAAWGSGFDRMSAAAPGLERLVPPILRAQAERSAAVVALARNQDVAGLAHSKAAVAADPLIPASSALLGSASQLAGDRAGAASAFRVSARLGWREKLTQLYWFDAAMRVGDVERAALRADAMLRADPHFAGDALLLAPLEGSEAGRDALARRLVGRPVWLKAYFDLGASQDDALLHRRAEVAIAAAKHGAVFGCLALRPLAIALLQQGARLEAERLWHAHCPEESIASGYEDGGFERLAKPGLSSPFGWQRHNSGDLYLALQDDGRGGFELAARNNAAVSRPLVSQATDLAPGRYLLRADIRAGGKPALGRIAASLECEGRLLRPEHVVGDLAGTGQLISIGACDRQLLSLWLRPGSGAVSIDNLSILPAK